MLRERLCLKRYLLWVQRGVIRPSPVEHTRSPAEPTTASTHSWPLLLLHPPEDVGHDLPRHVHLVPALLHKHRGQAGGGNRRAHGRVVLQPHGHPRRGLLLHGVVLVRVQPQGHDEHLRFECLDRRQRRAQGVRVLRPRRAGRQGEGNRCAQPRAAAPLVRVPAVPGVVAVGVRVDGRHEHVGIVPKDGSRAVAGVIVHVEHGHFCDEDPAVEVLLEECPGEHGDVVEVAVPADVGRAGVVPRVRDQRVVEAVRGVGAGASRVGAAGLERHGVGHRRHHRHVALQRGQQVREDGSVHVRVVVARLRVHAGAGAGQGVVPRRQVRRDQRWSGVAGVASPGGCLVLEKLDPMVGGHRIPALPRGGEVGHQARVVRYERGIQVGRGLRHQRQGGGRARRRRRRRRNGVVVGVGRGILSLVAVALGVGGGGGGEEAQAGEDRSLARVRGVVNVLWHRRLRRTGVVQRQPRGEGEHARHPAATAAAARHDDDVT
mmetsp:Transcript_16058/g.39124  ORF Transcript_16058/g.39124 Transcript_16058/m.39124 type:complete len:489 (+) Transcript_16058:222-1688(+)